MKNIITIIFLMVFVAQINGQNTEFSSKIFKNKEAQKSVELDKSIPLFDSFNFLMMPQFGGLFNESFKYVKGITNLKNYFDDFDLGFKLGIKYKILDKMTFTSVYNIGVLRFNLEDSRGIEGAVIKTSFCYNF